MQRLGEINAFKHHNLRLHGADIATRRGWTGVPNFILESDHISTSVKLTYDMLLKNAREMDECFPVQGRLVMELLGEKITEMKISDLAEDLLPLFEQRFFIEAWLEGFRENFSTYVRNYL